MTGGYLGGVGWWSDPSPAGSGGAATVVVEHAHFLRDEICSRTGGGDA